MLWENVWNQNIKDLQGFQSAAGYIDIGFTSNGNYFPYIWKPLGRALGARPSELDQAGEGLPYGTLPSKRDSAMRKLWETYEKLTFSSAWWADWALKPPPNRSHEDYKSIWKSAGPSGPGRVRASNSALGFWALCCIELSFPHKQKPYEVLPNEVLVWENYEKPMRK